jgi:hypothetical protein
VIGITGALLLFGCGGGQGTAPKHRYWGAEIKGAQASNRPAGGLPAGLAAFRSLVGKAPAVLPFNLPFMNCSSGGCSWYWFPGHQMDAVRRFGSIPMLNWSSMSSPLSVNEPGFSLSKVIHGDFDAYIRAFALGAKQWGHPFFLRFNWEMNGNWFPWSETANGNQPGQSAAAWRHVHDIFAQVGATNATWVWCPNVPTTNANTDLHELYPGAGYVNWTCLDGYNWGAAHGPTGWNTFDQLFSAPYKQITATIAPTKPMLIGEVGSTENGGSKATWITDMFHSLANSYPQIRGVLWFDARDSGMDWPIETSQTSIAAFAQGIDATNYTNNHYSTLTTHTITPP